MLFLRSNLKLVRELGDMSAQGRTIGNLGNTHYLLGNYKKAIKYHAEVRIVLPDAILKKKKNLSFGVSFHIFSLADLQRLSIAEVLGDKVAARRAYSNLGNAQVFLGKYSSAAQYYL